jgi:hypothetical protein
MARPRNSDTRVPRRARPRGSSAMGSRTRAPPAMVCRVPKGACRGSGMAGTAGTGASCTVSEPRDSPPGLTPHAVTPSTRCPVRTATARTITGADGDRVSHLTPLIKRGSRVRDPPCTPRPRLMGGGMEGHCYGRSSSSRTTEVRDFGRVMIATYAHLAPRLAPVSHLRKAPVHRRDRWPLGRSSARHRRSGAVVVRTAPPRSSW